MSIKLVLLKSNEEVIADVKELVDENDKPIFIVLENAYCCKLIESPVPVSYTHLTLPTTVIV